MSDTSTRSGMLWEVERILTECKNKPQVLLMENVPQVHGEGSKEDFNKWQFRLEELGYKNYWQDLIATDYGIPQTRNRTFMVTILGDYNYTFPKPIPLKLKLKDMLEDEVDDKYYLSEKMIQGMIKTNFHQYQLKNRLQDRGGSIDTLTTSTGERCPHLVSDIPKGSSYLRNFGSKGKLQDEICNTLTSAMGNGGGNTPIIPIKNATQKGYLEATEGDGIDLSQPNSETKRGRVQKDKIQTLTTQNNLGVVSDLKIRKLTPKECFRLMGVKDEDYDKVAKNQSDSSLYHLAGDSIVVNVLMAIFKEMI